MITARKVTLFLSHTGFAVVFKITREEIKKAKSITSNFDILHSLSVLLKMSLIAGGVCSGLLFFKI